MEEAQDLYELVFKTGNRVPVDGDYVDQHGKVTHHRAHGTFPPCVGQKGECAWRRLIKRS